MFSLGKSAATLRRALTHPEFYYGFVGVAVLWQVVFVLLARDPFRYRPLMPITIPSLVDPVFGVLFVFAYLWTPREEPK